MQVYGDSMMGVLPDLSNTHEIAIKYNYLDEWVAPFPKKIKAAKATERLPNPFVQVVKHYETLALDPPCKTC